MPPEEVPALMEILRAAAEEQLSLVRTGTDASALNSALEFGRWIKVPAGMLAEARNAFKAAQDERERERLNELRRSALGYAPKASLLGSETAMMATGADADTPVVGTGSHLIGAVAAAQRAGRKLKSAGKRGKTSKAKAASASRVPAAASLPIGELFSR